MPDVLGKSINIEKVKEALSSIPTDDLKVTEKFVNGDHWQSGSGWTGWQPESNSLEAQNQFRLVERLFNSKNVCGGMVKRVTGATLGKEPDWEVVPVKTPNASSNGTGDSFQDADDALTRWWEDKDIHQKLKEFIANRASYGKAALRIFIPSGFVESTGTNLTVTVKDLQDALDKIVVEVPHYNSVIDIKDVAFGQKCSIVAIEQQDTSKPQRYEISTIDNDGKTLLRHISEAPDSDQFITVDLGGNNLTLIHGEYVDALISPTVKLQQKAVNHAKTGENFALANINFPETTFINTELATENKEDPVTNKTVETVKPMRQGAGIWRSLMGIVTERADGSQQITTPQVIYRDGADPEKFAKVADNNTRDMHQEAGMLYIYLADSEYASGDARIEAMTDYLILLVDNKTMIDNVGIWLLTTVLRLAYTLAGKTEMIDKFSVLFNTQLTIGRITSEDKQLMLDEVNAGLRSKRGYMIKAEVTDDPDGELAAIKADPPTAQMIGANNSNGSTPNGQPSPVVVR